MPGERYRSTFAHYRLSRANAKLSFYWIGEKGLLTIAVNRTICESLRGPDREWRVLFRANSYQHWTFPNSVHLMPGLPVTTPDPIRETVQNGDAQSRLC
jgi:hypothetical protein